MSDYFLGLVIESNDCPIGLTIEDGGNDVAVLSVNASDKGRDGKDGADATNTVKSVNGQTGEVVLTKSDIGLGNADNTADADKPVSTAMATALSGKADASHTHTKSDVGLGNVDNTADADKPVSTAMATALSGKADLVGGLVPTSQIPAVAITEFLGTVASQAEMLALTGQRGDWCNRSDVHKAFVLTADNPSAIGSWAAIDYPAVPVLSVNGQSGTVVLSKSDIGLGNVDNTADADKPVSTAVAEELALKCSSTDPRLSDQRAPTAHTHAPSDLRKTSGAALDATGIDLIESATQAAAQSAIDSGQFHFAFPHSVSEVRWVEDFDSIFLQGNANYLGREHFVATIASGGSVAQTIPKYPVRALGVVRLANSTADNSAVSIYSYRSSFPMADTTDDLSRKPQFVLGFLLAFETLTECDYRFGLRNGNHASMLRVYETGAEGPKVQSGTWVGTYSESTETGWSDVTGAETIQTGSMSAGGSGKRYYFEIATPYYVPANAGTLNARVRIYVADYNGDFTLASESTAVFWAQYQLSTCYPYLTVRNKSAQAAGSRAMQVDLVSFRSPTRITGRLPAGVVL